MKGLIIEDEKADAEDLHDLLRHLQPDLSCRMFEDGEIALRYIKRQQEKIDIFFIDRKLPQMDGFTLASKIREIPGYTLTPIVFVTGYSMGQLDAFHEYHCYSYLVKPLTKESVERSIGSLLQNLDQQQARRKMKRVIPLIIGDDLKYVDANAILGVEVLGRNCYVYAGKRSYPLLYKNMETALKEIGEPYCVRCHRSYAVNLKNVIDIQKLRRNIWSPVFPVETIFHCEISKSYYPRIMELYKEVLTNDLL